MGKTCRLPERAWEKAQTEEGAELSEAEEEEVNEPEEEKICSICGRPYTGWSCNAWPVNPGRCCPDCDEAIVVPHRIRNVVRGQPPYGTPEWFRPEWK